MFVVTRCRMIAPTPKSARGEKVASATYDRFSMYGGTMMSQTTNAPTVTAPAAVSDSTRRVRRSSAHWIITAPITVTPIRRISAATIADAIATTGARRQSGVADAVAGGCADSRTTAHRASME